MNYQCRLDSTWVDTCKRRMYESCDILLKSWIDCVRTELDRIVTRTNSHLIGITNVYMVYHDYLQAIVPTGVVVEETIQIFVLTADCHFFDDLTAICILVGDYLFSLRLIRETSLDHTELRPHAENLNNDESIDLIQRKEGIRKTNEPNSLSKMVGNDVEKTLNVDRSRMRMKIDMNTCYKHKLSWRQAIEQHYEPIFSECCELWRHHLWTYCYSKSSCVPMRQRVEAIRQSKMLLD